MRVLLLGLALSAAAGGVVVAFAFRTTTIVCYRPVPDDAGEDMNATPTSLNENSPTPFVRAPILVDPRFDPRPIEVVLAHDLKSIGPDQEGKLWTYAYVDGRSRNPDHVTVRIGIANGYGGALAEITFDPSTKSALLLVADSHHLNPQYTAWTDVSGIVRISEWELGWNTFVEVDLHGVVDDREASLHICAPLHRSEFDSIRAEMERERSHFAR